MGRKYIRQIDMVKMIDFDDKRIKIQRLDSTEQYLYKNSLEKIGEFYAPRRRRRPGTPPDKYLIHIYNASLDTNTLEIKPKRNTERYRKEDELFNQILRFNLKATALNGGLMNIENDKVVLTGTVPGAKVIVIPSMVDKCGGGGELFNNCRDTVEEIKFVAKLTTIPNGFCVMTNVKTIDFPDTLNTIGTMAFSYNRYIKELNFPASVRRVGNYAFANDQSLKVVTFNGPLKYLGEGAFSNCDSLEYFKVPNGIENILAGTFAGCEGLKEVIIPKSVKSIDERAFYGSNQNIVLVMPKQLREECNKLYGINSRNIKVY